MVLFIIDLYEGDESIVIQLSTRFLLVFETICFTMQFAGGEIFRKRLCGIQNLPFLRDIRSILLIYISIEFCSLLSK